MPLSILLSLVIFGIAGIAVLLHLMGKSRQLVFESAPEVEHHWHRQHPDCRIERVAISKDGHTALVDSSCGVGLVWSMGADAACRLLEEGTEVADTGTGLMVTTSDYTAPSVKVALEDPEDRRVWTGMIAGEVAWQT
ncbi:MAG: hypothetical protein GY947_01810 [Rhodobacteraceae bacterium]|nr:hypothetical protein [Paracoccaceae bacterium]